MHLRDKRGLTLTELLIAMAIFALGGASIVALFLANAKLSAQAVNMTRAAEITRNVRSYLTSSLTRPISNPNGAPLYRFDYPGASLKFRPALLLQREATGNQTALTPDELAEMAGKPTENTAYFRLPTDTFDATLELGDRNERMVELPDEGMDDTGNNLFDGGIGPEVYRLLPDTMRDSAIYRGYDPDDRMFYSFDFSIRRSVSRGSEMMPNMLGQRVFLEDLFVVHLRVYRGFDYREENAGTAVENERNIIYETSFMVAATR
ncbi:MAG: prepilin-type N-terminal cleavage/methylation domain-containing protein [Planctomycetes bacterium]|nr:prepilin-type N-terminal cleavage/methylation domain-containing protein [Planctomycetota bacterium]